MGKAPNNRYEVTVALTVEIGASDYAEAETRLEAVRQFLYERLGRSTFERMAGQPKLQHIEFGEL